MGFLGGRGGFLEFAEDIGREAVFLGQKAAEGDFGPSSGMGEVPLPLMRLLKRRHIYCGQLFYFTL